MESESIESAVNEIRSIKRSYIIIMIYLWNIKRKSGHFAHGFAALLSALGANVKISKLKGKLREAGVLTE